LNIQVLLICVGGCLSLRFQDGPLSSMKNSDSSELSREYCMGLPWCPGECSNFCAPVAIPPAVPVAAAVATAGRAAAHRAVHGRHHRHHRRRKSGISAENTALIFSITSSLTVDDLVANANFVKIVKRGLATALLARFRALNVPTSFIADVAAAEAQIVNLQVAEDGIRTHALIQSSRAAFRVRVAFSWNSFNNVLTPVVFRAQTKTAAFTTEVQSTATTIIACTTACPTGITAIADVLISEVSEETSQVSSIETKTTFEWTIASSSPDAEFIASDATVNAAIAAAYTAALGDDHDHDHFTVAASNFEHAAIASNTVTESFMFLDFTVPSADAATQLAHDTAETVFRGKLQTAIALGLKVDSSRIKIKSVDKQSTTETIVSSLSFPITADDIDALDDDDTFQLSMNTIIAAALGVDSETVDIVTMAVRVVDGEITFNLDGLTASQVTALQGEDFIAAVKSAIAAEFTGIDEDEVSNPVIVVNGGGMFNLKEGSMGAKTVQATVVAAGYKVSIPHKKADGTLQTSTERDSLAAAAVAAQGSMTGFSGSLSAALPSTMRTALSSAAPPVSVPGTPKDIIDVKYTLRGLSGAAADDKVVIIEDASALAATVDAAITAKGSNLAAETVSAGVPEVDSETVQNSIPGLVVGKVEASSKYKRSLNEKNLKTVVAASYKLKYELHTPSSKEQTFVRGTLRNLVSARKASKTTLDNLISEDLELSTAAAVTCTNVVAMRSSTTNKPPTNAVACSTATATAATCQTTEATLTISADDTAESTRLQAKLNSLVGSEFTTAMKNAVNGHTAFAALEAPNSIVSLRIINNPQDTKVTLQANSR